MQCWVCNTCSRLKTLTALTKATETPNSNPLGQDAPFRPASADADFIVFVCVRVKVCLFPASRISTSSLHERAPQSCYFCSLERRRSGVRVGACNKHNAVTDIMRPSASAKEHAGKRRPGGTDWDNARRLALWFGHFFAMYFCMSRERIQCRRSHAPMCLRCKNDVRERVGHICMLPNERTWMYVIFSVFHVQLLVLWQQHKVRSEQLSQFPRNIFLAAFWCLHCCDADLHQYSYDILHYVLHTSTKFLTVYFGFNSPVCDVLCYIFRVLA